MVKRIPLSYKIFDDNGGEQIEQCIKNEREHWKLRLLHQSPPVVEVENFFTADECLQYGT